MTLLPYYQNDRATLYKGEALRVLAELPDASVDAVITDPPYSSGGQYRSDRMQSTRAKYVNSETQREYVDFTGDNRDQRAFAYWSALWLSECLRLTKPGGVLVMFCDWRQLPVASDAVQAGGWLWRGVAVWDKTEAARPQLGRYRAQAEYMVWASNGPLDPLRNVPCLPGVFRVCPTFRNKRHQSEKPVRLMREVVRICEPGGVVLDPFAGSGSTLVAALGLGYRVVAVEQLDYYADMTAGRMGRRRMATRRLREGAA